MKPRPKHDPQTTGIFENPDRLVSTSEAAVLLGLGVKTVLKYVETGKLRALKLGTAQSARLRIKVRDLEALFVDPYQNRRMPDAPR